MAQLSVYNLGEIGVDVDSTEIHSEDGELTTAQNAVKDPLGVGGGIVNRPGLIEFNGSAAAGTIAGGIGVPLLDQTSGTRTFYYGPRYTAGGISGGWNTSTNEWTSSSTILSGTPANPVDTAKVADYFNSSTPFSGKAGLVVNNRLLYASDSYTHAVTAPPIRLFDGTVDKIITNIPANPDVGTASSFGVVHMLSANNTIYLTTLDGGSDDTNFRGSVYQLDINSGALTKIGGTLTTGHVPYCLAFYLGRLWVGTKRLDTANVGIIASIRPGIDTAWATDLTLSGGLTSVNSLLPFQGELYAACNAATGTSGVVRKRTTLGTWSTVETGTGTANYNGYLTLVEFNSAIYVSYWDTSTTEFIRKFDGSSWSTVFTRASGQTAYSVAHVHNSKLYFGAGSRLVSSGTENLLRTTDGSSWTNVSVSVSPSPNAKGPIFGAIVT